MNACHKRSAESGRSTAMSGRKRARSSSSPSSAAGRAELQEARQTGPGSSNVYKFFHGTTWEVAQKILREGFRPSVGGCLGAGIYVARRENAEKFAKEHTRHAGAVGGWVASVLLIWAPGQ